MSNDSTVSGALAAPRRNHFFYGKLLDEMHLRMEQEYFSGKRRLLNRLMLGEGVLCGLQVTVGKSGKALVVNAGVAIDGAGREIIVPQDMAIDPAALARSACGGGGAVAGEMHLVVCYRECMADYQPALVTDCPPDDAKAPSTIVESFVFELRDKHASPVAPPAKALCAALNDAPDADARRRAIAGILQAAPCAEHDRNCCVTLANLTFEADGNLVAGGIDPIGPRKQVYGNALIADLLHCLKGDGLQGPKGDTGPQGPKGDPGSGLFKDLISIVRVNWMHDDATTSMSIPQFMEGLKATFSDKVIPRNPAGHHQGWFFVDIEYDDKNAGAIRVQRVLDKNGAGGAIDRSGRVAMFKPDERVGATISATMTLLDLSQVWVRVSIRCQFLVDEKGRPVDGNFFGKVNGRVKGGVSVASGDRLPGGSFESWFSLTRE